MQQTAADGLVPDPGHIAPQPLPTRSDLVMHHLPGTGPRLVVALAGIGSTRRGTPPHEFIGTASAGGANHVLLVSDPHRQWLNGAGAAEDLVAAIEHLTAAHGLTQVATLGNSMGGFIALVLPSLTRVDVAVALAPQFSVKRALVPEETRWAYHVRRIDTWRFPDVGPMDAPGTSYFVLHGAHEIERPHWLRMPWHARVHHFIVEGADHTVARALHVRALLRPAIHNAFDGRPRVLRRQLERGFEGRNYRLHRREAYQAAHPDLTLAPGGAPIVVPRPPMGPDDTMHPTPTPSAAKAAAPRLAEGDQT